MWTLSVSLPSTSALDGRLKPDAIATMLSFRAEQNEHDSTGQGLPAYTPVPSSPSICRSISSSREAMSAGLVGDSPSAIRPLYIAFKSPIAAASLHACGLTNRRACLAASTAMAELAVFCCAHAAHYCPQLSRRQVSSARKSPPTAFSSRMFTNRIWCNFAVADWRCAVDCIIAILTLIYPHRRVYTRKSAEERRGWRDLERAWPCAANQHGPRRIPLSAVRPRLFLHFAQHIPVASILCSCMIAVDSAQAETRQKRNRRPCPHAVDNGLHTLFFSPDAADQQHPLPSQSISMISNGLCAPELFSTLLLFRPPNSMCRCHRRVFHLRPDAVAT